MATTDSPIIVNESKGKIFGLWLGSLVLTAGGAWMVQDPTTKPWEAWGGLIFFGACVLIMTLLLIRPAVLTLGPEGFRVQMLWRNSLTRWDEVTGFRVWSPGRGVRQIAFDYAPGYKRGLKSVLGFGALPGNWSKSPQELLDLMTECKARWGPAQEGSMTTGAL